MPSDAVDIVNRPPWSAVRVAIKLLTVIAEARTAEEAEDRFDHLTFCAQKSIAFTNAAYLAAQVLRDMDVLSRNEATYVWPELFDLRSDEYLRNDAYHQAHLNAFVKETTARPSVADSETRADRLLNELGAREDVLEARFHRARGEIALAELVLRDADAVISHAVDGEYSLISGKLGTDDEEVGEPDPAVVAAICERIAALATAETARENVARYGALAAALGEADVASAMAAMRELRHIGLVSFAESIALLTDILDPLVSDEIESDRECARLQARIGELTDGGRDERGHGLNTGKARRVLRGLKRCLEVRGRRLLAMSLRRFGEDELATLVIEQPKEFERPGGVIGLGAWGGAARGHMTSSRRTHDAHMTF